MSSCLALMAREGVGVGVDVGVDVDAEVGEEEREREGGRIDWLQGFRTHIRIGFTSFPAHLRCHPAQRTAPSFFRPAKSHFHQIAIFIGSPSLLVSSRCNDLD